MSGYDWLVDDSEGEEDMLVPSAKAPVEQETSEIQTATFTTLSLPQQPAGISSASLFTPPRLPDKPETSAISEFSAETSTRPKPRPRPRPRTSVASQSWLYGDSVARGKGPDIDHSSTIVGSSRDVSLVGPLDTSADTIVTPATTLSNAEELFATYGIAERAKMRVRNARKSTREELSEIQSAGTSYRPHTVDVIELTSDDDDELSLLPHKPFKRQKPQPKRKGKKKDIRASSPHDSLFSDPPNIDDPLPPSSILAPSGSVPSSIPRVPATTPPEMSPGQHPLPSPSPRKRKRRQRNVDSDLSADDVGINHDLPESPLVSTMGPPLFFASSSIHIPENSAEDHDVVPAHSVKKKAKKKPVNKKKDTKKDTAMKPKKRKGKQQVETVINSVAREQAESTAVVDPHFSTSTVSGPGPPLDDSDLSPVPDSESEDVLVYLKKKNKDIRKATSPEQAKENTKQDIPASTKRKGKGNNMTVLSDVEVERSDIGTVPPTGPEENVHPQVDATMQKHRAHSIPSFAVTPGRSASIGPNVKVTAMSDLIQRVNSRPGSPFATVRSKPAYSPYLKSSRSLLSRIAPLHPNRRTPPPPPPRLPPPKKTKKQLEMEERIEEELAETIEGWVCMSSEERKELKRARINAELGED